MIIIITNLLRRECRSKAMTEEYTEYVESVAANSAEMIAAIDVAMDALMAVLPKQHWSAVTQIGKEMQDGLIGESYQVALAPFVQPPEEEIAEGGEKSEDEEKSAVPPLVAGMIDDEKVRHR